MALLSGQSTEDIRAWQALGLLKEGDDFNAEDLERVGLVAFAARRGVSPQDLARYCQEQGDWLDVFVRWSTPAGATTAYTRDQLAKRTDLEREVLDKVITAAGLRDRSTATRRTSRRHGSCQ